METDIKKEATELVTHGPQTALRIGESTPIEVSRQAGSPKNYTNSYLDSNFWPEGEEHPYYQINEHLEYAVYTLHQVSKKRRKRTCIRSLEEARDYLKHVDGLLLIFRAEKVQDSLRMEALETVRYAIHHERELSLKDLKLSAHQATPILEDLRQKMADLIVADEDARYPGCRNDEGELIVGGLSK